jgi:hypothetical protein
MKSHNVIEVYNNQTGENLAVFTTDRFYFTPRKAMILQVILKLFPEMRYSDQSLSVNIKTSDVVVGVYVN